MNPPLWGGGGGGGSGWSVQIPNKVVRVSMAIPTGESEWAKQPPPPLPFPTRETHIHMTCIAMYCQSHAPNLHLGEYSLYCFFYKMDSKNNPKSNAHQPSCLNGVSADISSRKIPSMPWVLCKDQQHKRHWKCGKPLESSRIDICFSVCYHTSMHTIGPFIITYDSRYISQHGGDY